MRQKVRSLKIESLKWHRIITVFGDVRIKRRLYRDSNGKHHFLLDEKMGLDQGCQVSPKVKELATFISSHFPFQRSEEILGSVLPISISRTSIYRLVGGVTKPYLEGKGEIDKVDRILIQAQQNATIEGAKGVGQLRGYLMENSFGLRDYRLEIGGDGLKSSLGTSSAGIDSWNWRFNLMIIRDSH